MPRKGGARKKKPVTGMGAAAAAALTTLRFTVVAPPPFYAATADDELPSDMDTAVDLEETPAPASMPATVSAAGVADLLKWFAKGVAADGAAGSRLDFAPSLSKEERAVVHSTVTVAGLGGVLECQSEGIADQRRISVFKKGSAPSKVTSSEVAEKAATLYKWARDAGLTNFSRDEITEQLCAAPDGSALAPALAALWTARSAEAGDTAELAAAVAADDAGRVAAILAAKPGLVGAVDSATGQPPLHAAARLGCVGALRALAAAGARLEEKDAHGRTALQISRTFEQCDAEAVLLQLGAHDPEAGRFPLTLAAAELGNSRAASAAAAASATAASAAAATKAAMKAAADAAAAAGHAVAAAEAALTEALAPGPAAAAAKPAQPSPEASSAAAAAAAAAKEAAPEPATPVKAAPPPASAVSAASPAATEPASAEGTATSATAGVAGPVAAAVERVRAWVVDGQKWAGANSPVVYYAGAAAAAAAAAAAVTLLAAGRRR
ncbi:hypothetical protein HYH03_015563 [Edaphochlamys debaryana]|uniref:R3H domain-containing protein n=1 Tax=Edaphochlamys debaryana TaxID=47281 RepID=A0A836BSF1_9CHLO|nr:hypothetical protein HYH03_015563 [Edaphochlamys debaryana]|eukprot:KAG2485754.1 hypothetical protein HYH03_015563 [Edaphochlamys debaryana]